MLHHHNQLHTLLAVRQSLSLLVLFQLDQKLTDGLDGWSLDFPSAGAGRLAVFEAPVHCHVLPFPATWQHVVPIPQRLNMSHLAISRRYQRGKGTKVQQGMGSFAQMFDPGLGAMII